MANDQAQSDIIDLVRRAQALSPFNPMASSQMVNVVKLQEGFAEEFERFARAWFQRRNEATQSLYQSLHEVNGAGRADPAVMVEVITNWQRGSFERLSADMQDWSALCMRCASEAVTAQSDIASADTDQTGTGKSDSKSASGAAGKTDGTKEPPKSRSRGHATPV